jgi:hypothetical protein
LSPIVIACVLNQSKDHWLCSDALNNAITVNSMLKEDIGIAKTLNQSMDDDCAITLEFVFFFFNIKKEVCDVFHFFFSFLRKYEKKRS